MAMKIQVEFFWVVMLYSVVVHFCFHLFPATCSVFSYFFI